MEPNLSARIPVAPQVCAPVLDLQDGLSPDEAALGALASDPGLRALRLQRGVAEAQLLAAGILPNPELAVGVDVPNAGATKGTVTGFDATLTWEITSLLGRGHRKAAARTHLAQVELDIAWQEWQVAQAARLSTWRLLALEPAIAASGELVSHRKLLAEATERGLSRGDLTADAVAAALAGWKDARSQLLDLEAQQRGELLALRKVLGLEPEAALPLQQVALPSFETVPEELDRELAGRRLDLLALRQGYESQDETLRAAIQGRFPRLVLGPRETRDTTNVISTGVSATLSVPIFDRNQGAIAIERATREQLYEAYLARWVEARSELAKARADLAAGNARLSVLEAILPDLERTARSRADALARGDADLFVFVDAQGQFLSARIERAQLELARAEQGIALELAAGRILATCPDP